MKYLLMIYVSEKRYETDPHPAEFQEYMAFNKEMGPAILGGHALKPTKTATTVRIREGKRLLTDGPFAETKEQLGGYYLVEARDLDEALQMAAKIPGAQHGSVEVRAVQTY